MHLAAFVRCFAFKVTRGKCYRFHRFQRFSFQFEAFVFKKSTIVNSSWYLYQLCYANYL